MTNIFSHFAISWALYHYPSLSCQWSRAERGDVSVVFFSDSEVGLQERYSGQESEWIRIAFRICHTRVSIYLASIVSFTNREQHWVIYSIQRHFSMDWSSQGLCWERQAGIYYISIPWAHPTYLYIWHDWNYFEKVQVAITAFFFFLIPFHWLCAIGLMPV